MIKFRGLGGDIGISKDQIQSIQKADPGEPTLEQTQLQEPGASPQSTRKIADPGGGKSQRRKGISAEACRTHRSAKRG